MSLTNSPEKIIQNLRNNIAIVEAFKNGNQLQYRLFDDESDHWEDLPSAHIFNFSRYEYLVKPEPNVAYIVFNVDYLYAFSDRAEAAQAAEEMSGEHGDSSGMVRKFIEVLE
ncbi:hypothetical protein XccvBFoX7_gp93c [Xanthomonas phage FoX7]|uniref:Uncharacterized protein n=2 Tax=Carpasinavirus XcP1 TaxID=2182344 RepID=A0A858NQ55_9CAUD|nr:hypothetical protein XccvBFoX6_gp93c [Xanthomonas phage FoX6]QJB22250.1 hypothetical protein XccvBFoX7_gp93c [Xanthomonas phage FoX7]